MATTYKEIAPYSGAVTYYKYDIITYGGLKWWAKKTSLGAGNPAENTRWTRSWYFVPTYTQEIEIAPKRLVSTFGEGYFQTTALGMSFDHNIDFSFKWQNISDRETKGILEFVREQNAFVNTTTIVSDEAQSGFWLSPPFPYTNYAGIYKIMSFQNSYSSYNKNSFSVNFKLKKLQASP